MSSLSFKLTLDDLSFQELEAFRHLVESIISDDQWGRGNHSPELVVFARRVVNLLDGYDRLEQVVQGRGDRNE